MNLNKIFLVFAFQVMSVLGNIWSGYDPREIFKASDKVLKAFEATFNTKDEKKCLKDFKFFTKELHLGREWTEKMINSYGRLPQGIYSGNKIDYGYFDQCLKIDTKIDIKPQYCLLPVKSLHQNQSMDFQIGICVPDSCSTTQVQQIMKSLLNEIGFTSDKKMDECVDTTPERFGMLEKCTILVVFGIILIIFISTVYELVQNYRKAKTSALMTSFSLQRNLTYLLEPKQDPNMIECINGIRVFTDGWIIVFHLYFFMRNYMRSVHNPEDLDVWKNSIWNILTLQSHLAVDTCFLIGGLCLSYNFMIARERRNKFNLFKFYLHRYIRLTPAYAATMVLLMFVYNVRPGPVFEPKNYMGLDSCRRYWWAALIYSQIYTNCDEPCMPVTWYLNVDMHLHIISPILLFALWKFGYKCMPVIVSLILYSIYQLYTIAMTHQIHIAEMFELTSNVAMKFYCPTHVRYATWLMGVTLGFILYKKRNTPSTLSTFKNVYIWINVIILTIYTVLGAHIWREWQTDVQISAYLAAPHRVVWTLCMAWIVYACIRGRGGFINWFFSLPYWKPIAKLNYCNYLIHQPFIVLMARLLRVELHFDGWIFLIMALGVYFFSLVMSIPWTLMFEIPFLNVEKAIWGIIEERKTKEKAKKIE
ncbi:nose resistant to fluoxetine protein 6-like [Culicoides brevitarsis]|uniref:nose resistant to fluoxetine protein 6-like n=1 Tax=Culicoides brevitarsis TaxID=469753 RepID=UPI00307BF670